MQQFGFHCGISTHRQGECNLRSGQPAGAVDEFLSQGADLLDMPQSGTLVAGLPFPGRTVHPHFAVALVCKDSQEEIYLTAGYSTCRHIVRLCLRIEFSKDNFISIALIVEARCLPDRDMFAGNDDLDVLVVFVANKQARLDSCSLFMVVPLLDKLKVESLVPARRLTVVTEMAPHCTHAVTAYSVLDKCLVCRKSFERHADGELDTSLSSRLAISLQKKELSMRDTMMRRDKIACISSARVGMNALRHWSHVRRPVWATAIKQWVVAVQTFFLAVKGGDCIFSEVASEQYRAVKVQCDAGKALSGSCLSTCYRLNRRSWVTLCSFIFQCTADACHSSNCSTSVCTIGSYCCGAYFGAGGITAGDERTAADTVDKDRVDTEVAGNLLQRCFGPIWLKGDWYFTKLAKEVGR